MKKIVIIVAGGSGKRMKAVQPKQFLRLKNRPILMHTIELFHRYDPEIEIRVVLPENTRSTWQNLVDEFNFTISHQLFNGGHTRFHSVKNGLSSIPDNALVAVQDGVRPLTSLSTISRAYEMAEKEGAVVPVLPLTESIREKKGEDTMARDRTNFFTVQTPQVFRSDILLQAYNVEFDEGFTDDASVVESAGFKVATCKGNEENIKITSPKDLLIAAAILDFI